MMWLASWASGSIGSYQNALGKASNTTSRASTPARRKARIAHHRSTSFPNGVTGKVSHAAEDAQGCGLREAERFQLHRLSPPRASLLPMCRRFRCGWAWSSSEVLCRPRPHLPLRQGTDVPVPTVRPGVSMWTLTPPISLSVVRVAHIWLQAAAECAEDSSIRARCSLMPRSESSSPRYLHISKEDLPAVRGRITIPCNLRLSGF